MTVDKVTTQLDQIAIANQNADITSPPAKLMKTSVGTVHSAQPLADRQANVVSFDPALPVHVRAVVDKNKKDKPVKPATFGASETGKTPKKPMKRVLEKGVAVPVEVMDRWDRCTGIPLLASKYTKCGERLSRSCCMCKEGTTSWYCMGCKSWFCMSSRKDTETREKSYVCQTIKKEEIVFEMTCFQQKHLAAWEKEEGKERLELTVKKIGDCAADLEKLKGAYNLNF